ncbi:MAG: phage holin family protein [Betaproteobacteria bacterium]|nr:phage holin family protein [Betaproteobacteria bacterium]
MDEDSRSDPAQSGGLIQSVRRLAATLVAAIQTRLELLATEIEEERACILQLLLWGCVALFFLGLGVVMLTFFVVLLFWGTDRLLVTFLLAAAYLAAGVAVAVLVRNKVRSRGKLFSASLAELSKDREQLTSNEK